VIHHHWSRYISLELIPLLLCQSLESVHPDLAAAIFQAGDGGHESLVELYFSSYVAAPAYQACHPLES